ncbi:MAG: GIY-YIG nuclease family protein, partial [Epsilonproteobacteria bacterium]|nr:GIY-YIG nuclease family protein [Campylobacterota bacterium]
MSDSSITKQIGSMPGSAGVYIMKDRANQILYVGKAKNLRKRVSSYFQDGKPNIKLDPIKQHMIKNVAGIETLNTKTELDALIWEDRLIKEIQPKYNIKQKDDSSYPYLVLTMHDEFPKLLTRRLPHERLSDAAPAGFREISGDLYYGPLTPAKKLYSILKILRKLYKLIPRESNCFVEKRACIYYDIDICPAPCVGFIDGISYRRQIDSLKRFLDGGSKLAMKVISDKMRFASQHLQYEDALFWK